LKLFVQADFPVDPPKCWEVFESEAFQQRLQREANITFEVLEDAMEGVVHVRRQRVEPRRELPGFVARLLGGSKLSYVQDSRLDTETQTMDWRVTLDLMPDRVDVSGRTRVVPLPQGGCRRVVDGDIRVRVRLVGSRIETAVVEQFEASMARANTIARDLMREWVDL